MRKSLLALAALSILMAPAFAQTQQKGAAPKAPATSGQATQPGPKAAPAVRGPNDVFCGGVYLGSDPDPNVRQQMIRDYKHECE